MELLGGCNDDELGKAAVDLVLTLCRLTVDAGASLLEDFITQFSTRLATQVVAWTKGQCFMLHATGLLFDLHSKRDALLPLATQHQHGLIHNLVTALELPGDELRGEAIFLLYKISCLQNGIETLLSFCSSIITLVLNALLKTESDELRTNCIALLSVLAKNGVFDISAQSSESENLDGPSPNPINTEFVKTFAEAIKGSLLSSDVQVQLSSLQLLCHLCPTDMDLSIELELLVDEGIADYIFEVLRISDSLSTLAAMAVRTLTILSSAKGVFTQRLMFGIEAVLRVLQHSTEAELCSVQEDALLLLSDGLSNCPGILSSTKAEQIFQVFSSILQRHRNAVEDSEMVRDGTFAAACVAMTSLLRVPAVSGISLVHQRVLSASKDVLEIVLHSHSPLDSNTFRVSVHLLQEAFLSLVKSSEADAILDAFELHLLPQSTRALESLELVEEESAEAMLCFWTTALSKCPENRRLSFAAKLATLKWISLVLASTGRFRSTNFRELALTFIAALVDALASDETDDNVVAAMSDLPTDPEDLLVLLEQNSSLDTQLISSHCAVVCIFYTAFTHQDRVVDEGPLLASLEQLLIVNSSMLQSHVNFHAGFLIQAVSLYVVAKQVVGSTSTSSRAENVLVTAIQQNDCSALLSPQTPQCARAWIIAQPGLKPVCLELLHKLFHAAVSSEASLELLATVLELENGVSLVSLLFHRAAADNAEEDIQVLASVVKNIIESREHIAKHFHSVKLISTLRRWYVLWASKAAASAIASCLELLVCLLQTLTPEAFPKDGSWQDIGNQTVYLHTRVRAVKSLAVPILTFLCFICFKSCEASFLTETVDGLYGNREFCSSLKEVIIGFTHREAQACLSDEDEQTLCLALVYQYFSLQKRKPSSEDEFTVSYEHLCRVMHCFPGAPRVMAFCCLSERLQISERGIGRYAPLEISTSTLQTMVLLLQGFVLDNNELVQMMASSCLVTLLTSRSLTPEVRVSLHQSPWFFFLATEITRSCSSSPRSLASELKLQVLVTLLKNSDRLHSALTSSILTSLISTITPERLSFWEVSLFNELLRLQCLESEHVHALSRHFQSYRRACLRRSSTSSSSRTWNCEGFSCDSSGKSFTRLLEMVATRATSGACQNSAADVVAKIDEFLQHKSNASG